MNPTKVQTAETTSPEEAQRAARLDKIRREVVVLSGKGGVGNTVAVFTGGGFVSQNGVGDL